MNGREQLQYTLNWLRPHCMPGKTKVRIGSKNDGGYVLVDDLSRITAVMSFGIGDNVDFDLHFAELGTKVFQFDHTIDSLPVEHKNFVHHRVMVGRRDGMPLRKTLDTCGLLGSKTLLLKCDIEGSEWGLLEKADSTDLSHFEQILIELHDFETLSDPVSLDHAFRTLEKINRTHCVVHVHGNNNCSPTRVHGLSLCPVVEVTYVRRDLGALVPSWEEFPSALDTPNNTGWGDIPLGTFTYV